MNDALNQAAMGAVSGLMLVVIGVIWRGIRSWWRGGG